PAAPARAVSSPVPQSTWRAYAALARRLGREARAADAWLAAQNAPAQPQPSDDPRHPRETVWVCADGGGIAVDSVLAGHAAHAFAISCLIKTVEGLQPSIAARLYRPIPACWALAETMPSLCASLDGDRVRAGRYANAAARLSDKLCTGG